MLAASNQAQRRKPYQVMTKTQQAKPNVDALAIPAQFDRTGKAKGNGQVLAAPADGYPA